VLERLFDGHALELLGGMGTERATRGRDDQLAKSRTVYVLEELIEGRVLTVDRHKTTGSCCHGPGDDPARHDQAFFVCQGEQRRMLERSQCGLKTDTPRQGIDYDIGAQGGNFPEAAESTQSLGTAENNAILSLLIVNTSEFGLIFFYLGTEESDIFFAR
jgi:hypothetical protein